MDEKIINAVNDAELDEVAGGANSIHAVVCQSCHKPIKGGAIAGMKRAGGTFCAECFAKENGGKMGVIL